MRAWKEVEAERKELLKNTRILRKLIAAEESPIEGLSSTHLHDALRYLHAESRDCPQWYDEYDDVSLPVVWVKSVCKKNPVVGQLHRIVMKAEFWLWMLSEGTMSDEELQREYENLTIASIDLAIQALRILGWNDEMGCDMIRNLEYGIDRLTRTKAYCDAFNYTPPTFLHQE